MERSAHAAYPRFHQVMADDSATTLDAALIDAIVPLVDGLPTKLSNRITVADIGCGRGHAVNLMARTYPASRFTGYDFEPDAIETARREAKGWGLDNVTFEVQDVTELEARNAFDLITAFDAIHDQAHPAEVLAGIYRALRSDGTFLMVDIKANSRLEDNLDNPYAPFLYTVSVMHCMTVSLALDGDGLGTVWGQQKAVGMLDDAGFSDIEVLEIEDDPINNYYVARKPARVG